MIIEKNILDKKEDICEELKIYISYNRNLKSDMLRHPLVYSVPHSVQMNALVNAQLKYKKDAVKKALEVYDYESYIWLHERPYRLQAFMEISKNLSNEKYWEILSAMWTDCENIWQNKSYWKSLLSDRPDTKHLFMSDEDRSFFNSLPETVTIYRGYIEGKNKRGFSYTLSKEKAEWFAKRYWNEGEVLTRTVNKSDIFAYTNERGEQEIIITKYE